tara:strand:- start:3528 stop:6353 length:2826 start_codon:yes stop_codon:yes gene_type:complete
MPKLLVDEYLEITKEYRQKYGENTIVWMQTGSFYEVYAWDENTTQIHVSRDILQIRITKKKAGCDNNGQEYAWMAGFPDHSYKRFEKRLLSENYTIVYVDQISRDPIKRGVVKVVSPGCSFDSDNDDTESILISVLVEHEQNDYYAYYSKYDSNRGEIDIHANNQEPGHSFQEVYENLIQFVCDNNANEVILNIVSEDNVHIPDISHSKILFHHNFIKPETAKNEFLDFKVYQNNSLESYFKKYDTIYENIIDSLQLSSLLTGDVGNLILMLDFLKEHEPLFVQNLPRPNIHNYNSQNNYLEYYNNTLQKLQIISYNKSNNLLRFIDKTLTNAGSKKVISLLKSPSSNIDIIQKRYDSVDLFINNRNLINYTKTHLKICDLNRLYRRFALSKICPNNDIPRIANINTNITKLIQIFQNEQVQFDWIPNQDIFNTFKEYCSSITNYFNIDNCKTNNGNVFNTGIIPELDNLYETKLKYDEEFEQFRLYLSNLIQEPIYLKNTDKDGFFYETTKKRGRKIQEILNTDNPHNMTITNSTSNSKICSKIIKDISDKYFALNTKIENATKKYVSDIVSKWYDKYYYSCLSFIIESLTWIDVFYSYAVIAIEWNYVRPTLSYNETSFFQATKLRHPIIEQLLSKEKKTFVPNDITLGKDNSYLLYGVNSVGKSSLLKSVGISVIMAQAGMFVPCSSLILSPYQKILVRIGNNDNLFESHSSFICEIREANTCIRNANNKSLILADEFCASTERESANQIVVTMLQWISNKQSSFIFATHLFELINHISHISNIQIAHLKVQVNKNGLLFERTITQGPPTERNYGTIVAQKIFKDPLFIKMLQRQSFNKKQQSISKRSRYNKGVVLSACEVCGYIPDNDMALPLDTHHINMQCRANKDGFIDNYHKNNVSNLVVLCKKCHINAHNGTLNISGWKQMDTGTALNFHFNN